MKNIKSLIVSLCLAIALMFSGTVGTNVYAEDPQNPPTSPQPSTPPSLPPEVIRIIITVIGTLL